MTDPKAPAHMNMLRDMLNRAIAGSAQLVEALASNTAGTLSKPLVPGEVALFERMLEDYRDGEAALTWAISELDRINDAKPVN